MRSTVLEKELGFFSSIKGDLLKNHRGKFVLIHGTEFAGAFDTGENAYEQGVARFGREPFLIKQVTETEPTDQLPAFSLGLTNADIS